MGRLWSLAPQAVRGNMPSVPVYGSTVEPPLGQQGHLPNPLPPSTPHSPVSSPLAPHPRGQTSSDPHWGQWSVSLPGQDCRRGGEGEGRMRAPQDDTTSERNTENTIRSTTLWGLTTSKPALPALSAFKQCLSPPQTVVTWIPRDARPQEVCTEGSDPPHLFDYLIETLLVLLPTDFFASHWTCHRC